MAKPDYADEVLRSIAGEALAFLFRNVNVAKIKCILMTGSLANGEGTVIVHNSSLLTSDFDFVVFLDFPYYMKTRNRFLHLSQEISNRFLDRRINTHIVFLPTTNVLYTGFRLARSRIYEYEFAVASKCIFGERIHLNTASQPTKRDALELVFTVISDLLFSGFKALSKIEESYIYAKRSLTLLNSLLIFHGLFAETYEKRMKLAKNYHSRGVIPLTHNEIKILECFTQYKLSGSPLQLLSSLSYSSMDDLLHFQREFLTNLALKILTYELNSFLAGEKRGKRLPQDCSKVLTGLLNEYLRISRAPLLSRLLGIALYLFWFLTGNKRKSELFTTFIFHRQPPKILLNVLLTYLLIRNSNTAARKFLRGFFPWINSDAATAPFQRLFLLWRTAEQSIKL